MSEGGKNYSSKLLPLFFIVLILIVLLAISGYFANFDLNAVGTSEISLDHAVLKVSMIEGGTVSEQLEVSNVGEVTKDISVSSTIGDLLAISDKSFSLDPGQVKSVELFFQSDLSDGVSYQEGEYVGLLSVSSRSGDVVELPLIVDIESETLLFDTNVNFPKSVVSLGEQLTVPISVYNLVNEDPTSAQIRYSIKDMSGNVVLSEEETVVVDTQVSFTKTIDIPVTLDDGYYVFSSEVEYSDSIGLSSAFFEVDEASSLGSFGAVCGGSFAFCVLFGLIFVLFLFFLLAFVYFFVIWYISGFYGWRERSAARKLRLAQEKELKIQAREDALKEKERIRQKELRERKKAERARQREKEKLAKQREEKKAKKKEKRKAFWAGLFKKKEKKKKLKAPLVFPKIDEDLIDEAPAPPSPDIPERHIPLPIINDFDLSSPEFAAPWDKIRDLIKKASVALDLGKIDYAELYYNQTKPLFLRLERSQKHVVYPQLVELQNRVTMERMRTISKHLHPLKKAKKKVRKKKRKKRR